MFIYLKTNNDGEIISSVGGGSTFIPEKGYDHMFEVDQSTMESIHLFKVEDKKLKRK